MGRKPHAIPSAAAQKRPNGLLNLSIIKDSKRGQRVDATAITQHTTIYSRCSLFSWSRRLPYRTAAAKPKTMIPTGGRSMTNTARLIARCPSFGVAFAFARHSAHP